MKCPFCAEEIKDEARLCRFCGSGIVEGRWQQPPASGHSRKEPRSFTMSSTGWLLIISGAWMLLSCSSPVPLFGAVRGGAAAIAYNGGIGALFLAMGYALAARKPWAVCATAAATAGYTIDKLIFIYDVTARRAYLADSSRLLGSVAPQAGDLVQGVAVQMSWAFLAGWWGLALYIYFKRSYFQK